LVIGAIRGLGRSRSVEGVEKGSRGGLLGCARGGVENNPVLPRPSEEDIVIVGGGKGESWELKIGGERAPAALFLGCQQEKRERR